MTAVHDEIKSERGRNPFLAHGVLFVPEDWTALLADELHRIRKEHKYFGEIHWREIRGASRGSGPFLVARDWITYYLTTAMRGCPFKAFIVEDGPNRSFPYPGDIDYPEHLLFSTKAVFKAGIAWSYFREQKLRLDIVYDDTDSEVDRAAAAQLSSFLQSECNTLRLDGRKRYPWLRVSPVRFLPSNPKLADSEAWPYTEFIQLCDLLLGASFQALHVVPQPDMAGRRQLARSIMGVLGDTLKVPWFQQVPVHRRFSVSLYPDRYNFAYPAALRMAKARSTIPDQYLPGFANLN